MLQPAPCGGWAGKTAADPAELATKVPAPEGLRAMLFFIQVELLERMYSVRSTHSFFL